MDKCVVDIERPQLPNEEMPTKHDDLVSAPSGSNDAVRTAAIIGIDSLAQFFQRKTPKSQSRTESSQNLIGLSRNENQGLM